MTKVKRISVSFTLRAYPGETNTIELINYLKDLGKDLTNKKVEAILMAALLPLAKQHTGKYTMEQLRLSALETRNALDLHCSYINQALNQASLTPQLVNNSLGSPVVNSHNDNSTENFPADNSQKAQTQNSEIIPSTLTTVGEAPLQEEQFQSLLTEDGNVSDIDDLLGD